MNYALITLALAMGFLGGALIFGVPFQDKKAPEDQSFLTIPRECHVGVVGDSEKEQEDGRYAILLALNCPGSTADFLPDKQDV